MKITVGQCLIEKVTEQTIALPLRRLFPDHVSEMAHYPDDASVDISVHSWLVTTPGDVILIDTATGNGRERTHALLFHQLNTPYLARLRQTGISPEQVTLVLLTHVHTDHVGWNTHLVDGEWQPLFPNARYICSKRELERCQADPVQQALYHDSILPLINSGQLEVIDIEHSPHYSGVLRYMPTPSHSSDHASLTLVSDQQHALFSGDLMHHGMQFEHPHWSSVFCADKPLATRSRRQAIDWAVAHQAVWFSSHFSGSSYGRVIQTDEREYQWHMAEEK